MDYPDIYGPVAEITATIAKASAIVLLLGILVTVIVARRTTRPVQDLEAFTRRVAGGVSCVWTTSMKCFPSGARLTVW